MDRNMEMVKLEAGSFIREDGKEVRVSAFCMDSVTLTWKVWRKLYSWAVDRGYELSPGSSEEDNTPVYNISWYDAVKFCNALSEYANREPVYYTDETKTGVYRKGKLDLDASCVKWESNGYRLPTEAEWEYACRAGTDTVYFWGDDLESPERYEHCYENACVNGRGVSVMPVAQLKPNPWGFHDISGNALEWCWDWYGEYDPQKLNDPHGPEQGLWRIMRGGSVALDSEVTSSYRHFVYPWFRIYDVGMRISSSNTEAESPLQLVKDLESGQVPRESGPDISESAVARRLAESLDLSFPGLEKVAALYRQGKYKEMMLEFRKFFIDYSKAHPVKIKQEKYLPELRERFLEHQDRINVYELCDFSTFAKTSIARFMNGLCNHYFDTGNPQDLADFMTFARQIAAYRKYDFDQLNWQTRTIFIAWNMGMGFVIPEIIHEMAFIAEKLPENHMELLLPEVLAETVAYSYLLTCRWVKDNRSGAAPNQIIHTAEIVISYAANYPYVKNSRELLNLAVRNIGFMTSSGFLPDGGDLERAFGYNGGVLFPFKEAYESLPEEVRLQLADVKEKIWMRHRFLYSIVQPFSGFPATGTAGTYHTGDIFRDRQVLETLKKQMLDKYLPVNRPKHPLATAQFREPAFERINNWLFGDCSTPPPAFTSIAFPYPGYYVMRNGWSVFSAYAMLIGSRPGRGHSVEDYNSLNIICHGRNFLLGGGAQSYGHLGWIVEDQKEYFEQVDDYARTSWSRNTIQVDGWGQLTPPVNSKSYPNPAENRWHTGENFDFGEGWFKNGYGEKDNNAKIPVTHNRQVIFVREIPMWIVIDRMHGDGSPHSFTNVWNFQPEMHCPEAEVSKQTIQSYVAGFREDEVICNSEQKSISTRDPDAPNVELFTFCKSEVKIEKFYGQLDPARGWHAPSIPGRRYPKVDTHTTWQGEDKVNIAVTAIIPSETADSKVKEKRDISTGDIIGFEIKLTDGKTIACLNSPKAAELEYGKVRIKCRGLVVYGESGMVLDDAENNSYVFIPGNDGTVRQTAGIEVPKGFKWVSTPDGGEMPVYDEKQIR